MPHQFHMDNYPVAVRFLVRLLLLFSIITALIISKTLLVPLFFAVLLSYMLYPSAEWLEHKGLPRIPTNFLLIVTFVVIFAGGIFLIGLLIATFTEDLPEIQDQMEQSLNRLQSYIWGWLGYTEDQQNDMVKNALGNTGQYITTFFTATANSVLAIGLIPVYTFLLLLYRDKFKRFVTEVVSPSHQKDAQNIIDHAAEVVPKYMKGLFVVCFILMGINSLGFYIVGVKYALMFGIIAAVFNLIPYLGTVIGYGLVFLFVLATQSIGIALGVLAQFFIVQFTENNILTPNITGSYVRINPLVTIFSLIAGGMIWGMAGMLMVIPYLAMVKIVCENIDSLKPVGFLLGNQGVDGYGTEN